MLVCLYYMVKGFILTLKLQGEDFFDISGTTTNILIGGNILCTTKLTTT